MDSGLPAVQARSAPGMARPAWWVLDELLAELGRGDPAGSADAVFDRMAETTSAFAGLTVAALGLHGAVTGANRAAGATA